MIIILLLNHSHQNQVMGKKGSRSESRAKQSRAERRFNWGSYRVSIRNRYQCARGRPRRGAAKYYTSCTRRVLVHDRFCTEYIQVHALSIKARMKKVKWHAGSHHAVPPAAVFEDHLEAKVTRRQTASDSSWVHGHLHNGCKGIGTLYKRADRKEVCDTFCIWVGISPGTSKVPK